MLIWAGLIGIIFLFAEIVPKKKTDLPLRGK